MIMNGADKQDSTGLQVYIPAAPWRDLLQRLRAANLQRDAPPPADLSASKDALRAIIECLEVVPAIRESGVIRSLQGLLAALPGLLQLAARNSQCWCDLSKTQRGA